VSLDRRQVELSRFLRKLLSQPMGWLQPKHRLSAGALGHSKQHGAGTSGGGYGALKLAFTRPHLFAAVAAKQPMLEPGLRDADVGPRNRLHHSAGGPPQLIGPARDPALWESNNPASRARRNGQQIRDSALAIYLDAGDRDFLNAHDGAEFLHRELWTLDLSHEYHLVEWLQSGMQGKPPSGASSAGSTRSARL